MDMEFVELPIFINTGILPEMSDYVYQNSKSGYPMREDADYSNMYFITQTNNYIVELTGITSGKRETVDLTTLTGNWWICNIPNFVKNQVFK